MGLTFKQIASRLQIAVGTAHRIFAKFEATGEVAPSKQPKRPASRKIDDLHELYIIGILHENPAMYLHEICHIIFEVTGVSVTSSAVCKILYKNGYSRKKLTNIAAQRSVEHRGAFMAHILQYPREFLVWIDETGSDRRDQLRKFGYAVRGYPAVCRRILVRGTRISYCGDVL